MCLSTKSENALALQLVAQHLGAKLPASVPLELNVQLDGVRKKAAFAATNRLPPPVKEPPTKSKKSFAPKFVIPWRSSST